MSKNISQNHLGVGDNIAGDKLNLSSEPSETNFNLPKWAQWLSIIISLCGLLFLIYTYYI